MSLQCFLDLFRNFPLIRRHPSFKKQVTKEFKSREKFNSETSKVDAPRFCYKYNKTQSNTGGAGALSKNAKNPKCVLYVNHENFLYNLVEALLEPADMIQPHIDRTGATEESRRKYLQDELRKKQFEVEDLQQ